MQWGDTVREESFRDVCAFVVLYLHWECVCLLLQCVFFAFLFSEDFRWLNIQFKYSFRFVCVCSASHYMFASKIVCVYLQCNVLCFTCSPSPLCAPPYLSPTEMRWGQGIWGVEHREAALHNLKGILMNQHSRSAYSHDNRPQTNSCIWSPLVLWLWKCCMLCVCGCFCFWRTVSVCVCVHMSTSVYLHIFWIGLGTDWL